VTAKACGAAAAAGDATAADGAGRMAGDGGGCFGTILK